jgi:hypothetical protein
MKTKPTPAEGNDSAKQQTEAALRGAACSPSYSCRRIADLERALRQLMHLTDTVSRGGREVEKMQAYKNAKDLLLNRQERSTTNAALPLCLSEVLSSNEIHHHLDHLTLWQWLKAPLQILLRCSRLTHDGTRVIAQCRKAPGDSLERQRVLGVCCSCIYFLENV